MTKKITENSNKCKCIQLDFGVYHVYLVVHLCVYAFVDYCLHLLLNQSQAKAQIALENWKECSEANDVN